MTKLSSLKYKAVHFMLTYLYLLALISKILGLLDTVPEVKCEHEDANVIWRNTPKYLLSDVKAITWSKGNDHLMASWQEGKGFVEYPPYIGRLMRIGETDIKVRTANISDSGIYWLSLTLASVAYKVEAQTYLEVKAAPSSECKPRITRSGSFLMAELPPEGCGTPHLRTKWKHTDRTVIQGVDLSLCCFADHECNSSRLDLGSNPEPGEYMVCAEGESAKCYQGNISDLCTKYNISRDGPSDNLLTVILPSVLVPVLIVTLVAIVIWFKRGVIRSRYRRKEETVTENQNISSKEDNPLKDFDSSSSLVGNSKMEDNDDAESGLELSDIEKYLKELYERLVRVPLSPTSEGDDYVNISDMYVNIEFKKVEITDLNIEESNATSDKQREKEPLINKNQVPSNKKRQFSPILVFGDCGSGKTAWCKHLVQCWLKGVDIKDDNIGLNLPNLRKCKILLYLPLQFSDRGISFQELLKNHLFKETQSYLEFVVNYITKNAQEVLLVIDGLDIIQENIKIIFDILNDKHMSLSTVIVTSRPASLKILQDACNVKIEQMRLFRVCKMTLEDSKAYANNVLNHINKLHGKNFKVVNFWRFTEQLHIHDLLSVPKICLVLLHVWMKNEKCFIGITDIMLDIIHYYLQSATSDQRRKEFIEDASYRRSINVQNDITKLKQWNVQMEDIYILHVLSRIAAQICFSEIEKKPLKLNVPRLYPITDSDLQRICETGLLTEPLSLSANKKVSDMSFPDRIICEFFVSIFIALQEGKDCDFILSCLTASMQNSMIIHILYQLSDALTKDLIYKAIQTFGKENRNTMGDEGRNYSNEKYRYCIVSSDAISDRWLQWLLYNDVLHAMKLLFLSTALYCINTITFLELTNHENNGNIVFELPCLPALQRLTLDINKCTLLLCKEWANHVPCKLKQVVIRSVNISKGTLSLLISCLSFCADLKTLVLFPSIFWTDDDISLQTRTDLDNYSWDKLSKHIENNKKLKILELNNLILPGVVDTLLSRLNRYQNLEMLKLKNVSSIIQETSPLSHSSDTDNDDDVKPHKKVNLTQLNLERLQLKQSPITFLFDTAKKGKPIKHRINVLSISALEMPETSWETLGSQIGNLSLTEFYLSSVNPGGYLQILLDGVAECKTLNRLSLCKIGTGKMIPRFSFLAQMKSLSQLNLMEMKLDGSSSCSLFKEICECKQLQTLSLCNIEVAEIPETLSSVQTLTKLSVLTVNRVTIKGGSQSLSDFLNAFSFCETINVSKEHAVSIPSNLVADKKVIYLDNY